MGRPFINLSGTTIGQLKVLDIARREIDSAGNQRPVWRCKCSCGTIIERPSRQLVISIKKNERSSCGCGPIGTRPTHGMTGTKEHKAWLGMRSRCLNPNHHKFKDYGGRGIIVSPLWINDFKAFYSHIGPAPSSKHSVDRINNAGNYEPGNVRWATSVEQRANRREGPKTIKPYKVLGISKSEYYRRLRVKRL